MTCSIVRQMRVKSNVDALCLILNVIELSSAVVYINTLQNVTHWDVIAPTDDVGHPAPLAPVQT